MYSDVLQPILHRPKLPALCSSLMRLAKKIGPGEKFPPMMELTKGLGVAMATLDQGFSRLESQGVVERRQGSGIYVSRSIARRRIGMVFGSNVFSAGVSPFYQMLLGRCESRSALLEERFSFYIDMEARHRSSGEIPAHADLVEALLNHKLDGLLLAARASEEQETWLRRQGIPVVSFAVRDTGPWCVTVHYEELIRLGVQSLRDAGCHTIGLLGILAEHGPVFLKALGDSGLPVDPAWVLCPKNGDHPPADTHDQLGRDYALQLFTQDKARRKANKSGMPDGILITDDLLARGACTVLEAAGRSIGKDIKVATHATKGARVLSPWERDLARIVVDPEQIVDAMFALLEAQLEHRELEHNCVLISPQLA